MCGIIAYRGPRDALDIAIRGLKTLEYRGYDSWGVAAIDNTGDVFIKKQVGSVENVCLKDILEFDSHQEFHISIAHTRWATHGGVIQKNAHPHRSQNKRFIVVQNGIVENFSQLTAELTEKSYKFISETDTEVIANLIEDEWKKQNKTKADFNEQVKIFKDAVRSAFLRLDGRNAIVVLDSATGAIAAARQGSPLIVGIGRGEYFIASDIPAFLEYTNQVMYLDEGQLVVIQNLNKKLKANFFNIHTGQEITRRVVNVNFKIEVAEKGKYKHFMIKEIMDQKETIKKAVNQNDKEVNKIAGLIKNSYGTFSVACGTAGYASLVGEYLFAQVAKKHINFVIASEFASYEPFLTPRTLMLVTSQSGETADVLEAMESAKRQKVKIVSLVNVHGSSIAKKSDYTFYINAGSEKAVASTKAYTSQIALHTMLAYAADERLSEAKQMLIAASSGVNDMLNPRYEKHIQRLAFKLKNARDMYVIGRGMMYPVALEVALKIKEVSYVHADGLPGGELKHGTLALISKGAFCIVLIANDENKEAILSNAQEVKARGGYIIGISPQNNPVFDYYLRVPDVGRAQPIASIIPGQMLAYYLAVLRGVNPDKPRNLAKSVTVK